VSPDVTYSQRLNVVEVEPKVTGSSRQVMQTGLQDQLEALELAAAGPEQRARRILGWLRRRWAARRILKYMLRNRGLLRSRSYWERCYLGRGPEYRTCSRWLFRFVEENPLSHSSCWLTAIEVITRCAQNRAVRDRVRLACTARGECRLRIQRWWRRTRKLRARLMLGVLHHWATEPTTTTAGMQVLGTARGEHAEISTPPGALDAATWDAAAAATKEDLEFFKDSVARAWDQLSTLCGSVQHLIDAVETLEQGRVLDGASTSSSEGSEAATS